MKQQPAESSGRFRPAVMTPHELVRGRLLLRVTADNALGAPHCTLIVGPAGFGKTTLLAQAYRHLAARGDPILWLECNEHDADPSHFLNSLYAAGAVAGVTRRTWNSTPRTSGIAPRSWAPPSASASTDSSTSSLPTRSP